MSIIRTARAAEGKFTQVSNQLLQDARISDRARGLGARILSYPPDTRIDSVALANGTKEGRDAVRGALRELEEYGYLTRVRKQDDSGRWVTESVFTDGPVALVPAPGKPTPENPSSVPPAPMRKTAGRTGDGISGAKNQTRKEETRKDLPNPSRPPLKVATAPRVGDQKAAATEKDGDYLAAVADITSHMQWDAHAATKRKLADILKDLVPDSQQLPEIVQRSYGWPGRPDHLGPRTFRGRIRVLKKQIDAGVPFYLGATRAEVSLEGHEEITETLTWGWPDVEDAVTS